jgi:hypothetical protein
MHMHDWNTYRQQLFDRVGEFGKLSPDTVRAMRRSTAPAPKPAISTPRRAS